MFNITILFKVYYIRKSCIFVLFLAVDCTDVMSLYTTVFKNQIIYFWYHREREKSVQCYLVESKSIEKKIEC